MPDVTTTPLSVPKIRFCNNGEPAVLNAIHAAIGKPVRQLPLKNVRLV